MTAPIRLTEKQVEYLRACARLPQSPWSAGSTTVNRLREDGLIEPSKIAGTRLYYATDAGRAWLAANGGAK